MLGHTAGPWRTGAPEWSIIKAGANMQVAMVKWLTVGIQGKARRARLGAESVANARLIAAAPDLLAACERAKKLLEPEVTKEPDRTIFWELVAAINKATGKGSL